MGKKAYGTYEIAEICNVTPATVGNWVEKGWIPSFTTGGGHRRVWANDLYTFLKNHNIPIPDKLNNTTPKRAVASKQILIVDDEKQIRNVIKLILKKMQAKIEILEAADGFEAGEKIGEFSPQLVIIDLRLPGMNGLKVCKMIRSNERLKNTKILAISGHNSEESKNHSLTAGADHFLAKPFNATELRNAISNLIAHVDPNPLTFH